MWEGKVIGTKIRRVFNTHEDPLRRIFVSGIILLIFRCVIFVTGNDLS